MQDRNDITGDPSDGVHTSGAAMPAARPRARAGWRTRSMLATAVVSFIAGALTWHLVGFWTFVSGIVFNPQDGRSVLAPPPVIAATSGKPSEAPSGLPKATSRSPAIPAAPAAVRPVATASSETLADLLQCTQARKGGDGSTSAIVQACPPLRRRLPIAEVSVRANRQLDAREAAERLARGWQTGVSPIETGALPARN